MKKLVFYRCSICGNIAIKLVDSGVPMVCCGKPMPELTANTTEAATEKHIPVVETSKGMVNVKIGEVPHPMTPEHFIQFVVLKTNKRVQVQELYPNDAPETKFAVAPDEKVEKVYAYCNLHSLWAK